MKDYRIKAVVRGLAIIAFAVCLLLSKTAAFQTYPMVKIGMCIILAIVFIESLFERSWLGVCFPLGIAACLFQNELGLGNVSYIVIILAFVLIGIGLTLIFGKKKYTKIYENAHDKFCDAGGSEYTEDTDRFDLDNNMGTKTQYVNIKNLRQGNIDNALGQLTVYMNGTTIAPEGAKLDIDNGLGQLNIYFPKEFRVVFKTENGLGKINIHGEGSKDENQPIVYANVDNGLGSTDIYFE